MNVTPGYIVQDNNLLACSHKHIESVFAMLGDQKQIIKFQGGLDIDYLESWHVEKIKKLKIGLGSIWVACDRPTDLKRLSKARDLFSDFLHYQKRCYVLAGYDGDTPDYANRRCELIFDEGRGFGPFIQYYQPAQSKKRTVPLEWKRVIRKWSRPAAYRKKKAPT